MFHAIANIRFAVRPLAGAVLFCAAAIAAGCGGGGGGGAAGPTGPVVPPIVPPVNSKPVNCGAATCDALANQHRTDEFNNQYGLGNINAHYAYAYGETQTGRPFSGRGVTVAVVDSGVDRSHSEFAGRILPGYNATSPGNSVRDPDGHGTGVAGFIAAAKDGSTSGANVHGVAYDAVILPVQARLDLINGPRELTEGLNYAVTSGAFVVNNSWDFPYLETFRFSNGAEARTDLGPLFAEVVVEILQAADMEGVTAPALLATLQSPEAIAMFRDDLVASANNLIDPAEADRIVRRLLTTLDAYIRFAIDVRLNSPHTTFPVVVFSAGNEGYNSEIGRNRIEIIRDPTGTYSQGQVLKTPSESNNGGFWGQIPLLAPNYQGHWLNVVAVDRDNRIADFSNGCGASKDWCLAAPGVVLRTTMPGGNQQVGSGTSYAAPHVSGAAAVLKSAFPNLTAPQIVALLLTTALDLGARGVDEVYGHGLLDLENAARPQPGASGFRIAYSDSAENDGLAPDDFSMAALADSRIVASPALSPKTQNVPVGFLDGFDRAYQANLDHFVSNAVAPRAGFFFQPHLRDRTLQNGFYALGAAGDAPLAFGWKTKRGGVSADFFEVRPGGGARVSAARPGTDFAFALGAERARGMAVVSPNFIAGFSRAEGGNGADFHQAALAFSRDGAGWNAAWETGLAVEQGSALGAKFGGAFAVRRARTLYGRLAGSFSLSPRARIFATGTVGRTRADAGVGAVASFSELRSRGWEAGVAGDSWRLSFARPLRTSSGEMRLRTAAGYDESGGYAVRESRADLSSSRSWRAAAEWTNGETTRLRSEIGEGRRVNVAAEFLF